MPKIPTNLNNEKKEIAVIILTGSCNMDCLFCVTENKVHSMPWNLALDLLHTLKEKEIKNIVFGGGEPFLWPHGLLRLCKEAKDLGFTVQVGTNATRFPPHFEKIKEIDRFVLPYDSSEELTHNLLRPADSMNHHAHIREVMDTFRMEGKTVTFSTVVLQQNKGHLQKIADEFEEYVREGGQIHAWHLYHFLPFGRGGLLNKELLEISTKEYHSVCRLIKERKLPFQVYKRPNMYQSRHVDFYWMENGELQSLGGMEKSK